MGEEPKRNGKSMVLLTVIGVATLLVAIVGATFAYFSTTVDNGDNATPANISTGNTGTITYTEPPVVNMTGLNLTANWVGVLPFSVSSAGSVPQKISAAWANVTNTLCKTATADGTACEGPVNVENDFTWEIYAANSVDAVTGANYLDKVNGNVLYQGSLTTVSNGTSILPATTTIAAGGTNDYILVLKFNYLAEGATKRNGSSTNLQNYQQGKNFAGRMNVVWEGVS